LKSAFISLASFRRGLQGYILLRSEIDCAGDDFSEEGPLTWLYLILAGLVVGMIARLLLPGRDPIGFFGTLIVGVVGTLLGGYLWIAVVGGEDSNGIEFIPGVLTAMILLWIYRKATYGRARTRIRH
jgi:uncharacterized membrane protein YeaQ/YmgE (transglycosylase-associated protein family)